MSAKKAQPPLRTTVREAVKTYLADMGSSEISDLHRRLMSEVEPPLIREVLEHTGGNQSRAARMLGMTRNTLRARMRDYDIEPGTGSNSGRKARKTA